MLGESPATQKAKIEEASKGANDLTGLVKRKKLPPTSIEKPVSQPVVALESNGKRKAEIEDVHEVDTSSKKARVDGE